MLVASAIEIVYESGQDLFKRLRLGALDKYSACLMDRSNSSPCVMELDTPGEKYNIFFERESVSFFFFIFTERANRRIDFIEGAI